MSTKISIEYRSLKLILLPTESQKILINKTFGCCRQIFNTRLQEKIDFYTNNILLIPKEERKLKSKEIWKQFKPSTEKELKEKFVYLKEVSAVALQQSRLNCEMAFQNFYKSLSGKRKGPKIGSPKYKSKKQSKQSYREIANIHFDFYQRRIQIPKLGKVKFKSRNLPKWFDLVSSLKSITIERSSANRYYAVLLFELKQEYKANVLNRKDSIGLDFDCDDCYVDSNGNSAKDFGFVKQKQANSKRLRKLSKRLRKLSKRFNRKLKVQDPNSPHKINSKNREKVRIKLARFEEKIANKRRNWIEKETLRLVKSYNRIVVEDLNLKTMIKFSRNAKNYVDISWGNFISRLQSKGNIYNCQVVKAARFFASSQTCSNCGFKYPEVQRKHLENWICPNCGAKHQRDVNAAINLKHYVPIERRELKTVDSAEELVRFALA